jgi:hypothetical protein
MPEDLVQEAIIRAKLHDSVKLVWDYFLDLDRRRSSGGFSENPLSFLDIAAWMGIRRLNLEQWEIDAIFAVDDLKQKMIRDRQEKEKARSKK